MTETTQRLVIASNNPGKLAELGRLLAPLGLEPVAQKTLGVSEAEEPAVTFVENAILKARHAARHTGLPALADDSGLAVAALDGAPGVRSARYAGPDASDSENLHALLRAMEAMPAHQRDACFHCVLVYLTHADDPTPLICHGQWHGRILRAPSGTGGFGYDPVFLVPELECSAAELSADQKARLSHRGRALQQLSAELQRRHQAHDAG